MAVGAIVAAKEAAPIVIGGAKKAKSFWSKWFWWVKWVLLLIIILLAVKFSMTVGDYGGSLFDPFGDESAASGNDCTWNTTADPDSVRNTGSDCFELHTSWAEALFGKQAWMETKTGWHDTGDGLLTSYFKAAFYGGPIGLAAGFLGLIDGTIFSPGTTGWAGAQKSRDRATNSVFTFFKRLFGIG